MFKVWICSIVTCSIPGLQLESAGMSELHGFCPKIHYFGVRNGNES